VYLDTGEIGYSVGFEMMGTYELFGYCFGAYVSGIRNGQYLGDGREQIRERQI
jgi:hypothetical protein